jgi:hypothetical protein
MKAPALLFCLFACAAPSARPSAPPDPGGERLVKACVVNDADAPVDEAVVHQALTAVTREYADKIGVVIVPAVWVKAPFKPSGWPMDVAFALRKTCEGAQQGQDATDVRIVFTDRFVAPKDASMTLAGDGGQLAGDSHPYYGFVVAYSAGERWEARDAGGGRALLGTLRHEFGHLFGLEHVDDADSFMYYSSNLSKGRWTPAVTAALRAHRRHRWWPKA